MKVWIDKFVDYNRRHYSFSEFELAKMRYSIETILSEVSKMILLVIFFSLFGLLTEFFVVCFIWMSIRNFAGGFHCQSYLGCLAVTFGFFSAVLFIPEFYRLQPLSMCVLLSVALIANIINAPIVSKQRPAYSHQRMLMGKIVSSLSIFVWSGAVFLLKNSESNIYCDYITWAVFLQGIQLLFARGENYHAKIFFSHTEKGQ